MLRLVVRGARNLPTTFNSMQSFLGHAAGRGLCAGAVLCLTALLCSRAFLVRFTEFLPPELA